MPHPSASLHVWQAYQAARDREHRATWRTPPRQPPRPPYHHHPGRVCRLCGVKLTGRQRTWCADGCVLVWFLATDSAVALRHLVELHGRRCWECWATEEPGTWPWWETGHTGTPPAQAIVLEVEHVRPLWSLTDLERGELRWWLPFNLQLLCRPCHRRKSAREAGERAQVRRVGRP